MDAIGRKLLSFIVALPAILFLVIGVRWLVNPGGIAPDLGLTLETGLGLSSQIGDLSAFFMVAGLGAIGSTLGYDHFIRGDDFTFGQSTLMLLGSASGLAFGFGTAILLNMNEKEPMLILALSGYGAGTWLTRSILDVQPDGTLDHNLQTRMSVMPTIIPTLGAQDKINLIPGIDLRLSF